MNLDVPPEYRKDVEPWLDDLKLSGDAGKKLRYNFMIESRVPPEVWRKFWNNVSAKCSGLTGDPGAIIAGCVTPDMVLRGPLPQPRNKLPKRFSRVDDADSMAMFILKKDRLGLKPDGPRLLRYIDDEDDAAIRDSLAPYVEHKGEKIVWIGSAEETKPLYESMDHDNLRDHLGLYGKGKGKCLVLMTFASENIVSRNNSTMPRIPTVMEGKAFPAFTPAKSGEKLSGRLIDLRNGNETLREWVCMKVSTDGNFRLHKLPAGNISARKLTREPATKFLAIYAKIVDGGRPGK